MPTTSEEDATSLRRQYTSSSPSSTPTEYRPPSSELSHEAVLNLHPRNGEQTETHSTASANSPPALECSIVSSYLPYSSCALAAERETAFWSRAREPLRAAC